MSNQLLSCLVCYYKFNKDNVMISTFCGHVYHQYCLDNWLMVNNCCPDCRAPAPETHKIFFNFYDISELKRERDSLQLQLKGIEKKLTTMQSVLKEKEAKCNTLKQKLESFVKKQKDMEIKTKHKIDQLKSEIKENVLKNKKIENDYAKKIKELEVHVRQVTDEKNNLTNKNEYDITENTLNLEAKLKEANENIEMLKFQFQDQVQTLLKNKYKFETKDTMLEEMSSLYAELSIQNSVNKRLENNLNVRVAKRSELEKNIINLSNENNILIKQIENKLAKPKKQQKKMDALKEKHKNVASKLNESIESSSQLSIENKKLSNTTQNSAKHNNDMSKIPKLRTQNELLVSTENNSKNDIEKSKGTFLFIKGIEKAYNQKLDLFTYILELAASINIKLTPSDILKIDIIKSYHIQKKSRLVLRVNLQNVSLKEKFLKEKLNLEQTKYKNIVLEEDKSLNLPHNTVKTFDKSLLKYAKTLKEMKFYSISTSANNIFVKKFKNSIPIKITSTKQVDEIKSNAKKEHLLKIAAKKNCNKPKNDSNINST